MWRRHQGKNWALIVAECASGELFLQQAEGFGDGRLEMVVFFRGRACAKVCVLTDLSTFQVVDGLGHTCTVTSVKSVLGFNG